MSWFFVSVPFLGSKISFSRQTMRFLNALIILFSFCSKILFSRYWFESSSIIDFFMWVSVTSSCFSNTAFFFFFFKSLIDHDRGTCANYCRFVLIYINTLAKSRFHSSKYMWLGNLLDCCRELQLRATISFCQSKMFMK